MPAVICTCENYYAVQSGSNIPVFLGQRHQRGNVLEQTISGLFKRFVISFVSQRDKEVGEKILGNLVKTGTEMVDNVVSGMSVTESLKERGLPGMKWTITYTVRQSPADDTRVNIAEPKTRKKKGRKTVVKPESKDIRLMAFVLDASCECVKTELNKFAVPPTQTSIQQAEWVEHQPLKSILS